MKKASAGTPKKVKKTKSVSENVTTVSEERSQGARKTIRKTLASVSGTIARTATKVVAAKKAVTKAATARASKKRTIKDLDQQQLEGLQDFENIVLQVSEHATDIAEGEASKFNIGVTHNGTAMADRELSNEYGVDRVVLLVVDPRFVFTYWEVRNESMHHVQHQLGHDAKLTLRFYDISNTGNPENSPFWDIEVFDRLGNWYLRLAHPEQHLCLDIGLKNSAGHFCRIARSNVMKLPPQSLAKPGPIKWMVVSPSGEKLLSDIEDYTDADLALLKKILGPYFFDLLMRGRLASIAGSSVEAVFYDVQQLLRPPAGQPGESPSSGSPWITSR